MTATILFVDQSGVPGGAELCLLDLVRDHLDHSTVVLFGDGSFRRMLEQAGARVVVLPIAPQITRFRRESGMTAAVTLLPYVARTVRALTAIARRHDIVLANTQKAFALAALAAWRARRPCIWSLHDIISADHFGGFNRRLSVRLANLLAARVVADSHATAVGFLAAGGNPRRLGIVPIGLDERAIEPADAATGAQIRQMFGIPETAILVGSFSRLSPWKGQHVLIEAIAQTCDLHALIVGKELFGEADYAVHLRQLTAAHGLEDRVHFYGFTERISEPLAACDIVVHTSTAPEPFGRVLIEGMLSRRPLVAARAGGALEIVEDGRSGLLVTPGDSGALAARLSELAVDVELRRKIGDEGRLRAATNFSLGGMLAGFREEIALVMREGALVH